jgi:NAD(P)-dependent dehydrogenase (short-subunit alcohol dehydrogenase family)
LTPLAEQQILITGATDGLGKGVALELARGGASLLLHGRDEDRGERTIEEIREATGNQKLSFCRADFASLGDVRAMAGRVLADRDRLDVLVNNAGIGTVLPGDGERMESADGYELRFQVNYLAGFLLTRLLEPLLIASAPARIVNVSSAGQMELDFDDLMLERSYTGVRAYMQSKLAQVLFTFDLAEELADRGVSANCLHPATFMPTKMVFAARGRASSTLEEGIEATLRLITDADGVTGRYFNGTREARADPQAYDVRARRRLREISAQLVGP